MARCDGCDQADLLTVEDVRAEQRGAEPKPMHVHCHGCGAVARIDGLDCRSCGEAAGDERVHRYRLDVVLDEVDHLADYAHYEAGLARGPMPLIEALPAYQAWQAPLAQERVWPPPREDIPPHEDLLAEYFLDYPVWGEDLYANNEEDEEDEEEEYELLDPNNNFVLRDANNNWLVEAYDADALFEIVGPGQLYWDDEADEADEEGLFSDDESDGDESEEEEDWRFSDDESDGEDSDDNSDDSDSDSDDDDSSSDSDDDSDDSDSD